MSLQGIRWFLLVTLLWTPTSAQDAEAPDATAEDATPWGHSAHGAAYDAGPRQRPWMMEGIGSTPFPITSSNPEVQPWFDQAMTLLHGFWWYEAERSLRWCLKLDPECAMAYWGMSVATQEDGERSAEFLKEASKRKDTVTERERSFIEVAEKFAAIREADGDDREEAKEEAMIAIDRLLMDYPDDVEAKAMYWLMLGRALGPESELARYGMEAVLDDILEINPDHVGALHYRVHNWDGKEGHYVVDTCMRLPEIAPQCGHLLHMPGHVLSGIGLWHEAAIAMDRATRIEKAYMNERLILPEQNWDYAHNLDYLCYIQEQLGMVDQALIGTEQLAKAPAFTDGGYFTTMVKLPAMRALVKFERWEELLEEDRIAWDMDNPAEEMTATYARLRALIGLERLVEAEEELDELRKKMKKSGGGKGPGEGDGPADWLARRAMSEMEGRLKELDGLMAIANGDYLEGLGLLSEAAEAQEESWLNDPPHEPVFLFNVLGDAYLELGAPKLAAECYERTLETVFHDGFALAGLVVAYAEIGDENKARQAMAKLGVVWSDAELPNRWLAAAQATGITAKPCIDAPIEQRNYKQEVLDVQGPSLWIPSALPELTATNAEGESVTLADYRGHNVLLIFYLGEECVHCIEQINLAEEHLEELDELDTVVLAVSRDAVEEIAEQQESLGVLLLSDVDFANARRFQSFDDFEEIELHSTFLVNRAGRLHWSRIGGEPFTDFDYLTGELKRMNRILPPEVSDADDEVLARPREASQASGTSGGR